MPTAFHRATDMKAESQSTVAPCQQPILGCSRVGACHTCKECINSHKGVYVREPLGARPHRHHDEVDDRWCGKETLFAICQPCPSPHSLMDAREQIHPQV
jgi:hypothetical protein